MNAQDRSQNAPALWIVLGAVLLLACLVMRRISGRFAEDAPFEDMPILAFTAGYICVAAIVTVCLPWLIRATQARTLPSLLILILAVGLIARLSQFGASTILEDDYFRYLWDGAVVSIGHSPFVHAPLDLIYEPIAGPALAALTLEGADVLARVNYPEYRTIYPPALQAVFAASHWVAPFSLDGWRVVLLGFELGIVGMIWMLLTRLGQSPLWLAIYWWNPVVIKEVANSAHMEPVLMLPVLVAMYAVLRQRMLIVAVALAIGAGIKVWPVILTAAFLRVRWVAWRVLFIGAGVMGLLLAVQVWPIVASGLDETSGFVAFGTQWRASSAVILIAEALTGLVPGTLAESPLAPRLLLGLGLLAVLLTIWARPAQTPRETLKHLFLITAALYLLSPSTTPWYFLWIAPFLCLFPVRGLMLAAVTLPLHYLYFHLSLTDQVGLYRAVVVWVIWVPVWAVLAWDGWQAIRARQSARLGLA